MEVNLSSLSRQIETLSKLPFDELSEALSPDAASELRKNLSRLSVALETPGEIVDRIVYSVSAFLAKPASPFKHNFLMLMRCLGIACRLGRHPPCC